MAGDVTADSLNQYAYDGAGHLCAVFSEGADTEYLYNAAGRRVAKGHANDLSCNPATDGFAPTNFYIIGPTGRQLSEADGSGNWLHTNVFAGGKLLATYNGNNTYFALTDWPSAPPFTQPQEPTATNGSGHAKPNAWTASPAQRPVAR